jgi:hypothetical protein
MMLMSHGFGEHIRVLESSSAMWEGNNLMVKDLLYGMIVNLYVLRAFMVDRIDTNLDGTSVINMQWCRLNLRKTKLCEKITKPNDLEAGNKYGTILNLSR